MAERIYMYFCKTCNVCELIRIEPGYGIALADSREGHEGHVTALVGPVSARGWLDDRAETGV